MTARRKVFKIVLEPAEDTPTESYVATSPNLPGLVTQGRGVDETIEKREGCHRRLVSRRAALLRARSEGPRPGVRDGETDPGRGPAKGSPGPPAARVRRGPCLRRPLRRGPSRGSDATRLDSLSRQNPNRDASRRPPRDPRLARDLPRELHRP